MPDIRIITLATTAAIVGFGTTYSVIYGTYLDTSNPLLSHLPHPLHNSNYFASKTNFLNVYFIKKAWAWTSAAFLFSWLTSPNARTRAGMFKWLAETATWLVFTGWFFGPAIIERVNVASGGSCVLVLPSGDVLNVPRDYCFTKSTISPVTHPNLFTTSSLLPSEWHATPRLRRGHDLSGHIFLLTMSILFLGDHLRMSFRAKEWPPLHKWAVGANMALIGIWLFACYTTSVYFHSPLEKVTGFLLGVASFSITQLAVFESSAPERPHQS